MRAQIDGLDVVSSGSFIVSSDQELKIFPFDNDEDYYIRFEPKFFLSDSDEEETSTQFEEDGPNGTVIRFKRKFLNDLAFANSRPLVFATDSSYEYLGKFAFRVFGKADRFTLIIDTVVYRKSIK